MQQSALDSDDWQRGMQQSSIDSDDWQGEECNNLQ